MILNTAFSFSLKTCLRLFTHHADPGYCCQYSVTKGIYISDQSRLHTIWERKSVFTITNLRKGSLVRTASSSNTAARKIKNRKRLFTYIIQKLITRQIGEFFFRKIRYKQPNIIYSGRKLSELSQRCQCQRKPVILRLVKCYVNERTENTELSARPSEQPDKRKQSHKLKFLRNTLL